MKKEFDIPTLDKENWEGVQASLDSIGRILRDLEKKYPNEKDLHLMSIHLGMIDTYLGRTYTLDEVTEKLSKIKEETIEDKAKRLFECQNQIWVLYCDPNLGDYCKSFVDKNGWSTLKFCAIDVFLSSYGLYQYASEHNIPIM